MTLPSWITLDSANSRLAGAAGQFSGTTQAEANASAQRSLDTFGDAAIADGSLYCYDFPVLLTTITGLGLGLPSQSTWDADNEFVWTARGYNGSASNIDRVNVNDLSLAFFAPAATTHGIQYVPDYSGSGTLQGQRIWFNRYAVIGHILPAAPYTSTNIFSAIPSNIGTSAFAPALWVPEKNMLFASQGKFNPGVGLRFQSIDFMTGVKTITHMTPTITDDASNYTYNPEKDSVLIGGLASVDIATLVPTAITLAGGRVQVGASAYCPDNGYIYIPYNLGLTYGVALMSAATEAIDYYVDISTTYIKGIVYHPARRYMYIYGKDTVTIIDTEKYALDSAMILGNITGLPTVIAGPTGVYSPITRNVYISVLGGIMYVIT